MVVQFIKKRITINLGDIIKKTSRKCLIFVLIHRVSQIPYSFTIQATCLELKLSYGDCGEYDLPRQFYMNLQ